MSYNEEQSASTCKLFCLVFYTISYQYQIPKPLDTKYTPIAEKFGDE